MRFYNLLDKTTTIARFKDNIWKKVGNLKEARNSHGAIQLNGITIIVGGCRFYGGSSLVKLYIQIFLLLNFNDVILIKY